MRRKRSVTEPIALEAGISVDSLRPCPPDDLTADYKVRRRTFRAWYKEREAWVARRESYAVEHGWPGGERARLDEEMTAHPLDRVPFDPAWEVAHGHL